MSSAVVSAEAERVPGWVEKHSDVLLRLGCSQRGAQGERLSDRGIEIADLEVEVHHRALCTVDGRPYRNASGVKAKRMRAASDVGCTV